MRTHKHLVLDTGVVVDLWLKNGAYSDTERIFATAHSGNVTLWLAATSLGTIETITCQNMMRSGIPPDVAAAR